MPIKVSTHPSPVGGRAEVWQDHSGHRIDFYGPDGGKASTENLPGADLARARQLAESWAAGQHDPSTYGMLHG